MKNIFAELYKKQEEILNRYYKAKDQGHICDEEDARDEYNTFRDEIAQKGNAFAMLYRCYADAMEKGNQYIDICETHQYSDEAALIAAFREYGITTFTFSSTWSSAVQSAWEFTQHGCTLQGMVQINSGLRRFSREEQEKRSAFLFKVEEV